ncbi:DUF1203 domain-containing protein [Microbulbifer sp. OS29]|uniref:DUF1203 domain-containing protein n=1 Tax=Microbulbifer okhotskensis TaxID=2926617 RepID=A0A9X2EN21_9GAMM|nr:DUF1203 domain-containing protein [Microbulbifer okhotskensis]MCO1334704.1 DUF1203 domain-containing protein [Microbulbifer okhotskensis]
MTFTVTPICDGFLQKVREVGLDDLEQPVRQLRAQGGEPCRDVLRRARPGEKILLASYCPFTCAGPYREYGPVFVLAQPEQEFRAQKSFPLLNNNAEDYFKCGVQLVLRAYSIEEDIVSAKLVSPEQIHTGVSEYFTRDEIDFALLRFTTYGCYALRLDRVEL